MVARTREQTPVSQRWDAMGLWGALLVVGVLHALPCLGSAVFVNEVVGQDLRQHGSAIGVLPVLAACAAGDGLHVLNSTPAGEPPRLTSRRIEGKRESEGA